MHPLNATGRKASGPAGAESVRARNATASVLHRVGRPHFRPHVLGSSLGGGVSIAGTHQPEMASVCGCPPAVGPYQPTESKPPAPSPRRRRRLTLTARTNSPQPTVIGPRTSAAEAIRTLPERHSTRTAHGAREGSQARRQEVDSEEGVAAGAGAGRTATGLKQSRPASQGRATVTTAATGVRHRHAQSTSRPACGSTPTAPQWHAPAEQACVPGPAPRG